MTGKKKICAAAGVLFTLAVAALASCFADASSAWYCSLEKPAFQPPAAVFPAVWAALYILLAVSFALYLCSDEGKSETVLLYLLNGVLNPLWTYVFFALKDPFGALILLIGMLLVSISLFRKASAHSKTAAFLLLPYIVWLSFALYLNYETAFLN